VGDAFSEPFAQIVTGGGAKKIQLTYQPVFQLSIEWNGLSGDHSAVSLVLVVVYKLNKIFNKCQVFSKPFIFIA
jgi:hypothetical protein